MLKNSERNNLMRKPLIKLWQTLEYFRWFCVTFKDYAREVRRREDLSARGGAWRLNAEREGRDKVTAFPGLAPIASSIAARRCQHSLTSASCELRAATKNKNKSKLNINKKYKKNQSCEIFKSEKTAQVHRTTNYRPVVCTVFFGRSFVHEETQGADASNDIKLYKLNSSYTLKRAFESNERN